MILKSERVTLVLQKEKDASALKIHALLVQCILEEFKTLSARVNPIAGLSGCVFLSWKNVGDFLNKLSASAAVRSFQARLCSLWVCWKCGWSLQNLVLLFWENFSKSSETHGSDSGHPYQSRVKIHECLHFCSCECFMTAGKACSAHVSQSGLSDFEMSSFWDLLSSIHPYQYNWYGLHIKGAVLSLNKDQNCLHHWPAANIKERVEGRGKTYPKTSQPPFRVFLQHVVQPQLRPLYLVDLDRFSSIAQRGQFISSTSLIVL